MSELKEELTDACCALCRARRRPVAVHTTGGAIHDGSAHGLRGLCRVIDHDVIHPIEDFHDPCQEWRRLFSELLGTFFLVLVAAGGGMMGEAFPDTISVPRRSPRRADGDGDHLVHGQGVRRPPEPGRELAFAARGDFPWRRVPGYIVVQLAGATLACLFLQRSSTCRRRSGRTTRRRATHDGTRSGWRSSSPSGLVSVILGTASGAQNIGIVGRRRSAATSRWPACGGARSLAPR